MLNLTKKEKNTINARFSENALKMMKKRYLAEREDGTQETPADMFLRAANDLAKQEEKHGKKEKFIDKVAQDFLSIMSSKEYTPAGRTLTNAGSDTPLIANCIVLPIHDSMESVFQTLKDAALLQQAGSGLGFDLSEMRPADFPTKKSRGKASGPVSFLRVYDTAFATIKQQGRHGANMAMMRVDHPDVLDFISCKETEGDIRNFNISITMTDEFMEQLEKNPDKQWMCTFKGKKLKPHKVSRHANGAVSSVEDIDISVKELFDMLVDHAWLNGEPGIAFIDTINRTNPLPDMGPIQASNPCGEQFLHAYDNCNLGSLNLAAFVKQKKVDYKRLKFATRTAVRLMDNVIDKFDFPVEAVTDLAKKNRRIGLGIMGFADMLYQMGVQYQSEQGIAAAEKVMGFINKEAYLMSQELAKEKGEFLNYQKSVFAKKKSLHAKAQEWGIGKKMRNAALTTVAPTGSISMMFDTSSGIEPNFALAYIKQDKDGQQYQYFNSHFKKALDGYKFSPKVQEKILKEVIDKGSIQHLKDLPKVLRDTFVVAMDIPGLDHMKMQAAFQRNVDNSISKTVNFPNEATKEEIADTFMQAWKMGCKACTVYRDGSRVIQILNVGSGDNIIAPTETPGKEIAPLSLTAQMGKKRPRPEIMNGSTYRIKTGYGKLYVTVNNDEKGVPFEVFATIGKSGGFFQEQSEAICRLISLALRSGVAAGEVSGDLKGIRGPMPVFTDKGTVLSLPDALGKILEQHVTITGQVEEVISRPEKQEVLPFADTTGANTEVADFGFMPGCPDCGTQLLMQEGCISCKSCGFSRCS
jgi:ribonucleoside-diphosphate reductase alpha chain